MQYMGGKSRISKQIAEVLNSAINKDTPFASLFCGSCAIESKVQADVKILNDKHPYLIAMWQAIQNGWTPPDVVTREEYYRVKSNMDENPALTGFVGFGCSFGGKWWGGYAKDKRGDDYCGQAKRSLLKDLSGVVNATFTCLDYKDVEIPDGTVVYCDPPYVNTTGYTVGQFDTNEFWNYMRQLSKRCDIYISEESAPDDFECVWSKEKVRTLEKNDNVGRVKVEKLFKYKG
nr:MAG TPA: DNA adenine methylase [Caudoviricetes sp.]